MMKRKMQKKHIPGWAVGLIWLALWTGAAAALGQPLLLPGPLDTLRALADMCVTAGFWQSTGASLLRVTGGFVWAVGAGTVLAYGCFFVPWLDDLLSPLCTVVRATPVTSFIILVLLWLNYDATPVFISFLMVTPMVWTGLREGLEGVDASLVEMTKAFHYTPLRRLWHLYVPATLPHFTAACATGLGFAWKSGIAAEVIAKPVLSIGRNLQDAKVYLETPRLFAWTLVVILLSLALEKILMAGLRRLSGWRRKI